MRLPVYLLVALLLLAFALESMREISSFQNASAEEQQRIAQETLERSVEHWEDDVIMPPIMRWLRALEHGRLPPESALRGAYPWFDGTYLWEPGGAVIWPLPHITEDPRRFQQDPCISRAEAQGEGLDRVAGARLLESCIGGDPLVSLVAASGAAAEYLDAHEPFEAERVLSKVDLLTRGDMALATWRGLPISRIASLRHQAAQAVASQGRSNLYDLVSLSYELGRLDADSLEAVMDVYTTILTDLHTPADAEDLLAHANRRIDALHEIREHPWDADSTPDLDQGPRLYLDPVGDPPYLLFYARVGDGDQLAAVQVDQPNLIAALFRDLQDSTDYKRLWPWLSVRDPGGRVLAGADGELGPTMAFTRVLPHLRVGLTKQYLIDNAPPTNLFAQIFPMMLGLFTGFAALLALIRADREQSGLMEQQREFVARVTHELKTPLAGIRLMAENLEMGAFRDSAQREKYAQQIIKESERLAARVDEVLRAANRPTAEKPTLVDLDTLTQELFERWKPLYEQQGATLVAELARVGSVRTQRGLLRDALYNLLDNALKYRREDRPGRTVFRMVLERRYILFDVEDNGIGVPANMRKAVFERFRRVEGPGRGLAGGHGLGLYFVAEAARMLGGKVDCTESANGGARFLLRIPRRG